MPSLKTDIELYVIKKVKEKRLEWKMSQSDLAFKLGVSYGFIGQVESKNYPTKYNIKHLDKLALIFKCSPRDFLPEKPIIKSID